METNCAARGVEYYTLIGKKDAEGIKEYLCPNVEFYSPMATLKGRDDVVIATSHFMNAIQSLAIRAQFGSAEQAMIVYDVDMPGIATHFPGASLLSFRDGMIVRIELFYDSARAVEKKEEIFGE